MDAKLTKLEAVYSFVAACIGETLAGDFLDYYNAGMESEADFIQYVPDGDIAMHMADNSSIEIAFGGDIYTVKISKARRQP